MVIVNGRINSSYGTVPPDQLHPATATMSEIINLDNNSTRTDDVPGSATKKRRFRFTTQVDILLCKAVSETGSHIAPRNEKLKLMEKACEIMVKALPATHSTMYQNPVAKTCNDHFELIVKQRREVDRAKRNQSGISEEVSELDLLLDDLILDRDTVEEHRRNERAEKTARDKRLEDAGVEVREEAMTRMSKRSASISDDEEDGDRKKKRKKRKMDVLESDDEEIELLKQTIADRREMERKKLELDQKRFDMDEKRQQKDMDRCKRQMDLEEKRLELEKQKMEMERQKLFADLAERRAAIEERKSTVGLMSALAKKLA